jgi:small-conductance mechanosensitive channel
MPKIQEFAVNVPFIASLSVSSRRHFVSRYAALALLLALFATLPSTDAADAPADKPSAEEKAAAAPVPLAELSVQAEAAMVNLRGIAAGVTADDSLAAMAKDLPAITREIEGRANENARILSQRPSLELLRNLERSWQTVRTTLALWRDQLGARIAALDSDLGRVVELENIWKETLALSQKEKAPPELVSRAQHVLAAVERTRGTVDQQRAHALRVQSRVAALDFRVSEVIDAIRQARDVTLARVLQRDSPPLWEPEVRVRAGERIAVESQEARESQWETLTSYVERRSDRILLHGVLFVLLSGLIYWARRRLLAWVREEPGLQHATSVVAFPVATALVLALLASRWVYPQAPRLMWAIIGASALIPTVLVLRRIAEPYLRPLLYATVVFFFADQVRLVAAAIELVPRLVFFAEMLGGTVFLLWFMRTKRRDEAGAERRHPRLVRMGVRLAAAIFAATAIANAAGYVALSNLLGNTVLRSMYIGLILYAAVEILDVLMELALRVRPLTLFGMVRRHRELLRRRMRTVLNAAAFLWWLLFVLDRLAVRDRVIGGLSAALSAELNVGAISVSLADVLAFVVAVWASFIVSRFVLFVLDEEIYPHARLKRGLPYAISRTLHYAILVAGFFVAMGVIGVDMTKFTILAGAFTVGVGFGLQNIFNNFVSGMILLFERPVQVGDVIQVEDVSGVIERIGIRASIVRTSNGSEVIVPNSKLISERLVNWSFSGRQRGIEVPISVVLGSDPARVIAVLERVAGDHPNVLKQPAPHALLVRLGPDWMGFELRAYTHEVEDWMQVRSELAVAVTAALVAEEIKLR